MFGFAALAEVALAEIPGSAAVNVGDLLNYVFRFDSQGAALADSHVGPLLSWSTEVLLYNPLQVLSTVALTGYWCMVTKTAPIDPALALHPNIKIVIDQTLMAQNRPSVVLANINVSDINIVQNVIGVYVRDGLQLI